MTNKCRIRMIQKELYNVRGPPPREGGWGDGRREKKERAHIPFMLCLIEPDGKSHPRMVSSFPRIMSPSSFVFLVPIRSSLTSTLIVVKLIKA